MSAIYRVRDTGMVDLGIDTLVAAECDLITLDQAAALVRGRAGRSVNREVMRRYAKPDRGRLFLIRGATVRLVLPTTQRGGSMRYTTVAWLEAWKRAYAELGEAERAGADVPVPTPAERRKAAAAAERSNRRLRKQGFTVN